MFCSGCGNDVPIGERFCRVCGKEASASPIAAPAFGPPAEGSIFPAHTSAKAIASLVCGLFLFAFPFSILAIVFGHIAVSEVRKSAGRLKGEGIAIAGLVLGYIGLAIIPLILIVAAIAIPNLLRARMAANESSAMSSIRRLVAAQSTYSSLHPEVGYTCSLSDLAAAGLIDSTLLGGQKNGYVFEFSGCRSEGPSGQYLVVAYPVARNTTGSKSFCSDGSGVVKTDVTASRQHCMGYGRVLR